jgi:hypothetical protein
VKLDGARADAKRACSFLAGGSPHDLSQRQAFRPLRNPRFAGRLTTH